MCWTRLTGLGATRWGTTVWKERGWGDTRGWDEQTLSTGKSGKQHILNAVTDHFRHCPCDQGEGTSNPVPCTSLNTSIIFLKKAKRCWFTPEKMLFAAPDKRARNQECSKELPARKDKHAPIQLKKPLEANPQPHLTACPQHHALQRFSMF